MAGPNYVLDKGFVLNGTPVGLYRGVVQVADNRVQQAGTASAFCVGFSQERVDGGDELIEPHIGVRILGITRAVAGAAITRNDRLAIDAQGRVVPAPAPAAGTTVWQVGIAMYGVGAVGDWLEVLLTPGVSRSA